MRIITVNTNGIRAAARKGFFSWMNRQRADVICIQETKAQIDQLDDPVFSPKKYHRYFVDAEKKGYSGVAIYSKQEPDKIIRGMGNKEFDSEGRYIEAQYGKLSVISLYMPSGSSGDIRQEVKYRCMDFFEKKLKKFKRSGRDYVICGDWNIAHKNEDLRNWRGNKKNSGFLPEERAWLDKLFDTYKFVDAFRELPQKEHEYTWWSNRGQAWANNTGWRIDYHICSPSMKGTVKKTRVYREKRFSDHAPLIIDYKYDLPPRD